MKKIAIGVCIVLMLLFSTALPVVGQIEQISFENTTKPAMFNGNTLYVGGSGPNNYTKIQDAIDDATYGDTVFVYSGIYYENIKIEKKINLIGNNKEDTIIIGSGILSTIYIGANRVKISGFTIKNNNTNGEFAGITICSNNNIITNNILTENGGQGLRISNMAEQFHGTLISENDIIDNSVHGIYLYNTRDCIVSDNTIYSNGCGSLNSGMRITYSYNTKIIGNTITYNYEDGIRFWDSHNSLVDNNEISYNGDMGIFSWTHSSTGTFQNNNIVSNAQDGIFITDGGSFLIEKNTICSNGRCGIRIQFSKTNTIQRNEIIGNRYGLYLLDTDSNDIIQNNYTDNLNYGIWVYLHFYGSLYNEFYYNNFRGNAVNAIDECTNTWYNEYNSKGNYWDDYTGEDNDGDGIGDTPYPIPGNNNEDRFPLMIPLYPPNKPKIIGPTTGKPNIEYDYTFWTNDVNGDNISYFVDWGDETNSGWTQYVISGDEITLKHKWSKRGPYIISCKAKDTFGVESDWGYLEVTMPMNQQTISNWWFLQFLQNHPRMFPILRHLLGV